jgi:hypothetical protein
LTLSFANAGAVTVDAEIAPIGADRPLPAAASHEAHAEHPL